MTGDVTGVHPACDMLPAMTDAEYRELVDDIAEHGLQVPILLDQDHRILDGRHRWRACQELGIEPKQRMYIPPLAGRELEAANIAKVISLNLQRRHLTTQQRAAVAAELATMKRGGDRTGIASNDALTDAQAAKLMGVSERAWSAPSARMRDDPDAHEAAKAGTRMPSRLRDEDDMHRPQRPAAKYAAPPRPPSLATIQLPQPAPGMRTWDDGDFIRQMLSWYTRMLDDVRVSPSACEMLAHRLGELARERKQGWSPDEPRACDGLEVPPS